MQVVVLILSIAVLAIGPLVHRLARGRSEMLAALDGFVLVGTCGLVIFSVLPEAFGHGGWLAAGMLLVGLFGPAAIEHAGNRIAMSAHRFAVVLACIGLVVHGLIDGVALSVDLAALPIAVVLHRIPMALLVWLVAADGLRRWRAWILVAIGVSTIAGFVAGEAYMPGHESALVAAIEATVGGLLLHVVAHRPYLGKEYRDGVHTPKGSGRRLAEFLGAVLAVGLVALVLQNPSHHGDLAHRGAELLAHEESAGHALHSSWAMFVELFVESAPALLIAYFAAGLLAVFVPRRSLGWIGRGGSVAQAARGMAFGLPLPLCSCGVLPVYKSLVERGLPATAAMAFLIATPELGIDAILISLPLLGVELTGVRLVAAAVVALSVGWFVGRGLPSKERADEDEAPTEAKAPLGERLRRVFRVGFGDLLDETIPWILVGIALAAVLAPTVLGDWIDQVPPGAEVALFALIGMPVYVCASGATPLAAVFIAEGVSPGAALAFLLTGPATNVTTFGILAELHGKWVALRFSASVFALSVALGYAVDVLFGSALATGVLADLGDEHSIFGWVAAGLLAIAVVVSLGRQGPRAFIAEVVPFAMHSHGAGGSGHDHDRDHDADPAVEPGCGACGPGSCGSVAGVTMDES